MHVAVIGIWIFFKFNCECYVLPHIKFRLLLYGNASMLSFCVRYMLFWTQPRVSVFSLARQIPFGRENMWCLPELNRGSRLPVPRHVIPATSTGQVFRPFKYLWGNTSCDRSPCSPNVMLLIGRCTDKYYKAYCESKIEDNDIIWTPYKTLSNLNKDLPKLGNFSKTFMSET